jgi:hypothetical protein
LWRKVWTQETPAAVVSQDRTSDVIDVHGMSMRYPGGNGGGGQLHRLAAQLHLVEVLHIGG